MAWISIFSAHASTYVVSENPNVKVCPGLLMGKYHLAVTVIDYGSDDGDSIIVISDSKRRYEDTSGYDRRDRPEIDERERRLPLDLPLQEITPTNGEREQEQEQEQENEDPSIDIINNIPTEIPPEPKPEPPKPSA